MGLFLGELDVYVRRTNTVYYREVPRNCCKVNQLERTLLKWNASAVNCPSNTAHQRFKNVAFAETSVWERRQAPAERLALTLLL